MSKVGNKTIKKNSKGELKTKSKSRTKIKDNKDNKDTKDNRDTKTNVKPCNKNLDSVKNKKKLVTKPVTKNPRCTTKETKEPVVTTVTQAPTKHKMLTKQGYAIKKSMLTEEKHKDLIAELTVKPKVHPDFDMGVESYPVYTEDNEFIYVPRFYGDKKFGKHTSTNITATPINIEFKGKLQDEQVEIVNICHKKILEDGGGVISVPCGAGKTVMVLDLICKLGLKALIIVPKSCLLKQTVERIQQFTTARVGIIRQNKVLVDNVDIVVGMIHSIAQKDYDSKIFEGFGVVAYDECHRSPSRVLSNAFKKAGARYTIGLSATPRRKDGLIRVMFWNIGNIIFKKDKKKNNKVFVHVINYDTSDKKYTEKKQYFKGQYKPSTVKTMTSLIDVENRNKVINEMTVSMIMENVSGKIKGDSYRKILVLSERIEHLKTLKQMFDDSVKRLIIQDKINREDAFTSGLYIGGMKQAILDYSAQADVIYGSYALAKEGLDIGDLNVLIMATPQKDIEQAVGRILRKQIQDDDIYPVVIDICESLFIYKKWYPERLEFYTKQEYIIQNHNVYETQLMTPKNLLLKDKKITEEKYKDITDHEVRKIYLIDRYGEYYYTNLTEERLKNYPLEDYASDKTFENMFEIDYSKYITDKEENSSDYDSEDDSEDISEDNDCDYNDNIKDRDECKMSNDLDKTSSIGSSEKCKIKNGGKVFDDVDLEDYDIFARAKKLKELKCLKSLSESSSQ